MYIVRMIYNAFDGTPGWEKTKDFSCPNFSELIETILQHGQWTSYSIYKEGEKVWPGSEEFEKILIALHLEEG